MGALPVQLTDLLDPKNLVEESKAVLEFIAEYYRGIEKLPVQPSSGSVEPGYLRNVVPATPPCHPERLESILEDIRKSIMPFLTHWQSPNFFGYFPASASTAAFLGEMLCSGFCTVGFNWASSPAATELENLVMDWMAKMLQLPNQFLFESRLGGGGVLLPTTCEAVLCTMAAARDRALEKAGGSSIINKLIVYVSDQTHATFQKAAKLVGIPPSNLRQIPTEAKTGYGMSAERLRLAMEADVEDGLVPLYVGGTVGSTGLNAVDPLAEVGEVCNSYGAWFHVDAAYAGAAAICPEFRGYLDGVELADSVSMNPHKWLLAGNECCCMWVKESSHLVQSLSTNPEYLRNRASDDGAVVDYKDWQMGLSRRFRAVKMWVVLRRYGVERLKEHVRSDVEMAKKLEDMVREDDRFEVVGERRFALLCFRMKGVGNDGNREFLDKVNRTGRAFLTHAAIEGQIYLRMSVGSTLTEERHVISTWRLLQAIATELLYSQP